MKNLNETLATRPRYPITIALQDDPEWSAYKKFARKQ